MEGRLVGREAEAWVAASFLAALGAGPAGLLICGEPGIGKTALWSQAVATASERGMRVLVSRPTPAQARWAFAGLTDLLGPVADDVLPELSRPQRLALEVALLRVEPRESGLDHRAVAAAMVTAVRHLAVSGPVVLAVDDIQWLDPPSAVVLDFAARRLGSLPIGLLVCQRLEPGWPWPSVLERAFPDTVRLELGPLSLAALHEIVKLVLGLPLPRRVLGCVERVARGNPFFALELVRAWDDRALADDTLRLSTTLREVVAERLAGLSRSVQAVLVPAAALRSPTLEAVAAATGRSLGSTLAAIEEAGAAGLVELDPPALRFTHPLFAAGVYEAASPAARRAVHRRLADHVREPEERARHLALAAAGPDADLAGTVEGAAEFARRRGAPDAAAELAESARRLTPSDRPDEALRRAVLAAEYHFHGGDVPRARHLLEDVLRQQPSDRLRADALRVLGEIHYHQRGMAEAVELFHQALDYAGADLALRASVQVHLAFAMNHMADWVSAGRHARAAVEPAEQLGDRALLAEALAVSVIAEYLRGNGLDHQRLDRALALEDEQRQTSVEMRPTLIAGDLMLYEGHLERSRELLTAMRQRLLDRGEDGELPPVCAHLAWNRCLRGELSAAACHVEEARESAERVDLDVGRCWASAIGAVVAAFAGDAVVTRERAEQALSLAMTTGFAAAVIWASWGLAVLALSSGDYVAGDAALAPLTAGVEQTGVEEPILCMFLADHIEALVGLGELNRAQRLVHMLERAGRRLNRGWVLHQAGRCQALLLAASGDLDRAEAAVQEALSVGQGLEHRLDYARTLLIAAQIERRCRRRTLARTRAEQALAIFDQCGAREWAQYARNELTRSAARPTRNGLSVTERRVAELAAAGHTNRQVASVLFVSPKTVEANLARVYRKLGIHSRAELGARLGHPTDDRAAQAAGGPLREP